MSLNPAEILAEEIAFAQGAIVRYEPLAGADGRLLRLGDRGVIRFRDDIPEPGRRRFVIAHELGHVLLHHGSEILRLCDEQDVLEWAKGAASVRERGNEFERSIALRVSRFQTA